MPHDWNGDPTGSRKTYSQYTISTSWSAGEHRSPKNTSGITVTVDVGFSPRSTCLLATQFVGGVPLHLVQLADPAPEMLLGRERRLEVCLDQVERQPVADDLGAETQDVDVVVLDALVGRVDVVAEGRRMPGILFAAMAAPMPVPHDHDPPIGLAAPDRVTDPLSQVGKVDRLAACVPTSSRHGPRLAARRRPGP